MRKVNSQQPAIARGVPLGVMLIALLAALTSVASAWFLPSQATGMAALHFSRTADRGPANAPFKLIDSRPLDGI